MAVTLERGNEKTRKPCLNLENFTDQTAESVYQDFYASVYLTSLESILTAQIDTRMSKKNATPSATGQPGCLF
jgi:hypothetical protein